MMYLATDPASASCHHGLTLVHFLWDTLGGFSDQGLTFVLTFVHFSAQPVPLLSLEPPNGSHKKC